MSKSGKIKEFLGIGEEEYEPDNDFETYEDTIVKKEEAPIMKKTMNMRRSISADASLIISKPETIDDAKTICDKLKDKKAVFVNLEGVDKLLAQRIVDFLGGSIYALEGDIKKVASAGFVVAPDNILIEGKDDEVARDDAEYDFNQ